MGQRNLRVVRQRRAYRYMQQPVRLLSRPKWTALFSQSRIFSLSTNTGSEHYESTSTPICKGKAAVARPAGNCVFSSHQVQHCVRPCKGLGIAIPGSFSTEHCGAEGIARGSRTCDTAYLDLVSLGDGRIQTLCKPLFVSDTWLLCFRCSGTANVHAISRTLYMRESCGSAQQTRLCCTEAWRRAMSSAPNGTRLRVSCAKVPRSQHRHRWLRHKYIQPARRIRTRSAKWAVGRAGDQDATSQPPAKSQPHHQRAIAPPFAVGHQLASAPASDASKRDG